MTRPQQAALDRLRAEHPAVKVVDEFDGWVLLSYTRGQGVTASGHTASIRPDAFVEGLGMDLSAIVNVTSCPLCGRGTDEGCAPRCDQDQVAA